MQINEKTLWNFTNDFSKAMKPIEAKYGIKVEIGNITYNKAGFQTRMNIKNLDVKTGEAMIDPVHEAAARFAFESRFGAEITEGGIIGQKFVLKDGQIITITDYDTKKPKYPILYERNGLSFKCTIDAIERKAEQNK